MRDLSIETTTEGSEQRDAALDRRSFIRGAAVIGAAVVGAGALAPSAEAAKRCYPLPPKKPSVVAFTMTAETGPVFTGRLDLETVRDITPPGGDQHSLSFELFFDNYESGSSVKPTMTSFAALTVADPALQRPPKVLVSSGLGTKIDSWTAIVERVFVAYTGFLEDGTPVAGLAVTHVQILEACAS